MQQINIRLFSGAHTGNLEAAQRTSLFAVFMVLLQVGLLLYLVLVKGFAYSLLGLYLLHLLAFTFLLVQVWLERNPGQLQHLTLTGQGVVYRTAFLKKEQQFDWDEVDAVHLGKSGMAFVLKNEEHHGLPFDMLHNNAASWQVLQTMVKLNEITLTNSQK